MHLEDRDERLAAITKLAYGGGPGDPEKDVRWLLMEVNRLRGEAEETEARQLRLVAILSRQLSDAIAERDVARARQESERL